MSIATTIDHWSPESIRRAVRLLHDQAAVRPRNGLTRSDATELLRRFGPEGAGEILGLAEEVGSLVRVSRHTIDEAGEVAVEARYFAMGSHP
jgi:hypothetical protein